MAVKFLELAFTDEVRQAQETFYGRSHRLEGERPSDRLTPAEGTFIRARDSFYMATVGSTGWPYLQHRGGAPGFIRMVDDRTLAFADLGGNRQLISTGNLAGHDRVVLFFMDYRRQARLKLLGHARMEPAQANPDLAAQLLPEDRLRRAERLCFIEVVGYDWNCPQHITPRLTFQEAEAAMAPLKARIAELEAQVADLTRQD